MFYIYTMRESIMRHSRGRNFTARPERWENPPAGIASISSAWNHLMTFLGGPRACIGFRFSIVEYAPNYPALCQ